MSEEEQELPQFEGPLHRLIHSPPSATDAAAFGQLLEEADLDLRAHTQSWPPELTRNALAHAVRGWILVESHRGNDGSGLEAASELCAALSSRLEKGLCWPIELEADLLGLVAGLVRGEGSIRAEETVALVVQLRQREPEPTYQALLAVVVLVWLQRLPHWEAWLTDGFQEAIEYIARLCIRSGGLEMADYAESLARALREAVNTAPFIQSQRPLVDLLIEAGEAHLAQAAQANRSASAEVVYELAATYGETKGPIPEERHLLRARELLDQLVELDPVRERQVTLYRALLELNRAAMRDDQEELERVQAQLEDLAADPATPPEIAAEALLIASEAGGLELTPKRLAALGALAESGQLESKWLSRINVAIAVELARAAIDGQQRTEAVERARMLLKAADQHAWGAAGSRLYSLAVVLTETAALLHGDYSRASNGAMEAMRILDPDDEEALSRALRLAFFWWFDARDEAFVHVVLTLLSLAHTQLPLGSPHAPMAYELLRDLLQSQGPAILRRGTEHLDELRARLDLHIAAAASPDLVIRLRSASAQLDMQRYDLRSDVSALEAAVAVSRSSTPRASWSSWATSATMQRRLGRWACSGAIW